MIGLSLKMHSMRPMKMFVGKIFLVGIFLLSTATLAFAEPCAPSQAFSNVLDFDRLASGQIRSRHDCDSDGLSDYQSLWTVVEFADGPLACRDPYDPRHLIVPRSGFYRILEDPTHVEVLSDKERGNAEPSRVPFFSGRDPK